MNKIIAWLMISPTDGPKSILILRLMAGGVFFWEGLLKFVYANQGVGRFTKLGMPFPHFTASFVGGLEIGGGLLLLAGLTTAADCDPVCGRDDRCNSVDKISSKAVAIAFALRGWSRLRRSPDERPSTRTSSRASDSCCASRESRPSPNCGDPIALDLSAAASR